MPRKQVFKAAQQRILARPRSESKSDQELLRKTEDDGVYPSPLNVKTVRLDRIVPDPSGRSRACDEASLDTLARSLLARGQLLPIVVAYDSDEDVFVLIDGERRWRAAQRAGLQTLEAIIVGRLSPAERWEQRLVLSMHSEHRPDPQDLETYKEIKGLATWADVAQSLGVSEAAVTPPTTAPEAAPLEPAPVAPNEAGLAHLAETVQLLDHAFTHLVPDRSEWTRVAQMLDDLEQMVEEQRDRLERRRTALADTEAKPIRGMPTWS